MNLILITEKFLNYLKQLPIDAKRKVAIDLLERFQRHLNGEVLPAPTKDEIKIAIDAIKELKQQRARSYQEHNAVEEQAEYFKQLINCWKGIEE